MTTNRKRNREFASEPHWYKDAVIYQIHVRAFFDSKGDGFGDFRGLTQKLDYLQDLGVTAIWLLPFYPSPLRDDGYDIADYSDVHLDYGTLADLKNFLKEAHRRGLRVITELVINHTSDQHAWFQRARRAPKGSPHRNFYVWADSTEKYRDARIIFKDFESSNWSWDALAGSYYWHRFYNHQPDLNFDNPEVHKALLRVTDEWLDMGVDGLRLDAIPYLYERESTSCENLPETHEFLKKLRNHVDSKFADRMLLAEANQWPEDAAAYFGAGDECHMAFHFPLMPRMFMALRMEDRYPIIDILSQTPVIPEGNQWAVFLRNHDELTLEMVTDEERDYMYRVYASDPRARINLGIRRRLAPLLENDRRKIELMNGLLFSMPGTPVIYYGDEIGMGDNIYLGDRNGVRTPMQWSPDRNAGFSRAPAQKLFLPVIIDPDYHYESVNVETRQQNSQSILWWMKKLIAMRKRFKAFSRGTMEFLHPENHHVLAFIRSFQDESILVVANLSRFAQYVELDLSKFKGMVPVETGGQVEFPPIGDLPYLMTLNGHSFYWFTMQSARVPDVVGIAPSASQLPVVAVAGNWAEVLDEASRSKLEAVLPAFLRARRWFGGKARRIRAVNISDWVNVSHNSTGSTVVFFDVEYAEGDPERYVLPLRFAVGEEAARIEADAPHALITRLRTKDQEGVLYAAIRHPDFGRQLLDVVSRRRRIEGEQGAIAGWAARALPELRGPDSGALAVSLVGAEQSNTSLVFGDRLIFKLFRKLDSGVNPDFEISKFLSDHTAFRNIPPMAGAIEYQQMNGEQATLGILQGLVRNEGDAWKHALDSLSRFYERVSTLPPAERALPPESVDWLSLEAGELSEPATNLIGTYVESARLLGKRTAELHMALASGAEIPAFATEPFTPFYQRSLYQSLRNLLLQSFDLLRKNLRNLPEAVRAEAEGVLEMEPEIQRLFREVAGRKITALRTRIHGDYHLGQVLVTGNDFVILDFEGEPSRSISERRIKRSPLKDVAGMLRSYQYAAYAALLGEVAGRSVRPEDYAALEPWAQFWSDCVSHVFLQSYLEAAQDSAFLPRERAERQALLKIYLLEKAVYEIRYELNNRPAWLRIPLGGIRKLLREPAFAEALA